MGGMRRFLEGASDCLRSAFRLRALMIAVAVAALGLAVEADRRRREARAQALRIQADFQMIADGRRELVRDYRRKREAFLKQAELYRAQIDRFEDPSRRRAWMDFSTGRRDGNVSWQKAEVPRLLARADWAGAMAENAQWAADHPREPWPPRPPDPDAVAVPDTRIMILQAESKAPVLPRIVKGRGRE